MDSSRFGFWNRVGYKLPVAKFVNRINGGDGDDVVVASRYGTDSLIGGNGNDILRGNNLNNYLSGGSGNDLLEGYDGDDDMVGGSGDDGVNGGSGNDYLSGDFGNDSIRGGDGNDSISGNEGNDTMRGGYGNDRMDGGSGDDFLSGDFGVDILRGRDGRDTLYEVGGSGNRMYGGELGDQITSAYHPNYSTADDQNFLYGEGGNDKLTGQGRDKLFGGTGNDTLIAKGGNNLLDGGAGLDIFDVRTSHEGVDRLSKKTTIQDFTVEDKIYVGEMVERIFIEQTSSAGFGATRVLGVDSIGATVPLATLTHGHGYQGEDLILTGGEITIA